MFFEHKNSEVAVNINFVKSIEPLTRSGSHTGTRINMSDGKQYDIRVSFEDVMQKIRDLRT